MMLCEECGCVIMSCGAVSASSPLPALLPSLLVAQSFASSLETT